MAKPGPLASSEERTNGAKLSQLIIDGGTTVLRNVFDTHHPPANLAADLNACYTTLVNLLHRRILNGHQWEKLFPGGGAAPDSNTFDITLLFLLLTNICGLTPPHTGWHCKPPPSDTSHEANLARIKFFRNQVYGHVTTTGVDASTFNTLWKEMSAVLVPLGLSQAEIDRLKAEQCGEEDYLDVLRDWAEREADLKTQLHDMRQLQTTVKQNVEENKSILKDLRIQQSTTQGIVEEGNFMIEDIHQIVTEIHETHHNTDQEDTIRKKLARVDTQRDVRDYTKRYLEGTRESFFAEINRWLDDKSSPNRVLVLSGNAGMGKSVIAAEMCRRMQEAGRLAGSHFCHHDRARHRNPKVMMQSLACHLSCCIPEYKKALVEQFSGNLGVEINDMEVVDLFYLLFLEPLNMVADPGFTSLVVIDALDESQYQGRNELLDVISSLFKDLPLWLRFFVTTRPEVNIWDSLKDLRPLRLEPKDEDNLKDIRFYFEQSLSVLLQAERPELVLDDLVQKSEGVFLCAQFLVDFIRVKCPIVLTLEQLEQTLPSGFSSVYQSYFQRLEQDLCKELNITEEQFLCFLSAIAAAREPLPLGFVPKLLCTKSSSLSVMRKVSKGIAIVSSLLPVHDNRIHFFHKSVKDWLTDKSCYEQHIFSVEEMEGHKILSTLCSKEFDELKSKRVSNSQSFTGTSRYALEHGVQHMLELDQDMRSCSMEQVIGNYVLCPELLYAKIFVNISAATEDIVCAMKHGGLKTISTECQETLSSLLIVLKKHRQTLEVYPFTIFQSLLNEGSSKLSSDSRQLLETKYTDRPYMEFLRKNDSPGDVQAVFYCFSRVACFDVSPSLEFMVCECCDGSIQLWSLVSGNLEWKRYVKPKYYDSLFRRFRIINTDDACQPADFERSSVFGFYRSVVFHPSKDVILPGELSYSFSFNGDLKPLFPTSKCSFSVCSIFGDEMLSDYPHDAKCLVVWNLNDGKEINRFNTDKDISSFAMSRDGKLVAVSHSTGSVCLVDRESGFSTLAETSLDSVCGMIRFSPDSRFLFCLHLKRRNFKKFCLGVTVGPEHHYSMDVVDVPSCNSVELEFHRIGGFLLGDPLSLPDPDICSVVVLNSHSLLRNRMWDRYIVMVYRNPPTKNPEFRCFDSLLFSLTGESVYAEVTVFNGSGRIPQRIMAYDVLNGEVKGQKEFESPIMRNFVAVKQGILFATKSTLELWNFDLSVCMRRWMFGVDALFSISDHQVACITFEKRGGIILDVVGGEIVEVFKLPPGNLLAWHKDLQLFASTDGREIELKQLGKTEPLWRFFLGPRFGLLGVRASFSPKGQFLSIDSDGTPKYVLDTISGKVRLKLSGDLIGYWKFISDEECVSLTSPYPPGSLLQLFNVRSGDLLVVMDVLGNPSSCLATFPRSSLIAIGSGQGLEIIKVKYPGEETLSSEAKKRKLQE
ncbi:uncharacterized protein [Montipora capricornis]|uniref:uncharacterized protein isoform X2 n=1 Tax=Montipora capricornis TaxID=246305 RepID=UPI0035F1ECC9